MNLEAKSWFASLKQIASYGKGNYLRYFTMKNGLKKKRIKNMREDMKKWDMIGLNGTYWRRGKGPYIGTQQPIKPILWHVERLPSNQVVVLGSFGQAAASSGLA
ncbi:unnamed protein product [Lupinus luteus]|uniref:PH domain-containing protein n=1 Tax=Lupinus luteus TaxID=3873 RepID=A0AAV1XMF0_LUPLU